jgi:hypothetical protein
MRYPTEPTISTAPRVNFMPAFIASLYSRRLEGAPVPVHVHSYSVHDGFI